MGKNMDGAIWCRGLLSHGIWGWATRAARRCIEHLLELAVPEDEGIGACGCPGDEFMMMLVFPSLHAWRRLGTLGTLPSRHVPPCSDLSQLISTLRCYPPRLNHFSSVQTRELADFPIQSPRTNLPPEPLSTLSPSSSPSPPARSPSPSPADQSPQAPPRSSAAT